MKPLSRSLAFAVLLGSLGLIGSQMQSSPAQGRAYGHFVLTSYAPAAAATTTYTIKQIVVSNATTGANGTAIYTFTVSPAEHLTAGQSVTISGLTGNLKILNNIAPVLSTNLTDTTFAISTSDVYASTFQFPRGAVYATIANGTFTPDGTDGFGTDGAVTISSTAPSTNPRNPVI